MVIVVFFKITGFYGVHMVLNSNSRTLTAIESIQRLGLWINSAQLCVILVKSSLHSSQYCTRNFV